MAEKLADFYQGETKLWTVSFASDISADTIYFRLAKDLSQNAPDLEVLGVALPPVNGDILGVTVQLTPQQSTALEPGEYYTEHEIRSVTRVAYFLRQKITVKLPLPKAS